MSIFKSMNPFKGNAPMKAVDNETEIVHDFNRRTPFWSYRPVAYRDYPALAGLKTQLDAFLDALFHGEIDEANGNVLDNLVFDVVRQAQADLRHQQISHRDTIKSFDVRSVSDRLAFQDKLDLLNEALNTNQVELKTLRARAAHGEFKEVMNNDQ